MHSKSPLLVRCGFLFLLNCIKSVFSETSEPALLLGTITLKQERKKMNCMMDCADQARKPFFYDVTLRDGNQALPKPWNNAQKKDVYLQLLKLGVQGAEVGFPASSEMDFESCKELAQLTAQMAEEGDEVAKNIVVSGLARCVPSDIQRCWEEVQYAPNPRIHTFLATSPLSMEHVLHMTPEQVKARAVECVKLAKSLVGEKGTVEFSCEHFGDCLENMDFVI